MLSRLLAVATVLATFGLLLIGGTVNPTGSSLACPDWPLCHGEVLPEMTGGVLFENGHRLAAWSVGFLTLALAVVTWRAARRDPAARAMAVVAVVAVAVQAILGGITVLFELPTLVSTAHLALALTFFLLLIALAHRLSTVPGGSAARGRGLARVLTLACFLQVVLGGFVRHTGAGRACGTDFPTCGGVWWPELWAARTQVLHRGVGVLLGVVVLVCGIVLARNARRHDRPLAFVLALAAAVIVVLQVVAGILTVTSAIGLAQVMTHFALGILLVACLHGVGLAFGPRLPLPSNDRVATPRGLTDVQAGASS